MMSQLSSNGLMATQFSPAASMRHPTIVGVCRPGKLRTTPSVHSSSVKQLLRSWSVSGVSSRHQTSIAAIENVDSQVETELRELTKLDYFQYLEDAGDDLVVVDFYTDWCGPCKVIYPELIRMSEEMASQGVRIVKFNCNRFNKELGTSLGIRSAPTFFLYKGGEKVAEMTGARVDKLQSLIDENK